jgi:hypothetical protein
MEKTVLAMACILILTLSACEKREAKKPGEAKAPEAAAIISDKVPQAVANLATGPLSEFGKDEIIVEAVMDQNSLAQTADQIKARDEKWQAAKEAGDLEPFMKAAMDNPCAKRLKEMMEEHPFITEIFVTDNQGANVCQTGLTGDYWQGDEAKFKEVFKKGILVSHPEMEDGLNITQVSVPVVMGKRHIGTMTIGVDIDKVPGAKMDDEKQATGTQAAEKSESATKEGAMITGAVPAAEPEKTPAAEPSEAPAPAPEATEKAEPAEQKAVEKEAVVIAEAPAEEKAAPATKEEAPDKEEPAAEKEAKVAATEPAAEPEQAPAAEEAKAAASSEKVVATSKEEPQEKAEPAAEEPEVAAEAPAKKEESPGQAMAKAQKSASKVTEEVAALEKSALKAGEELADIPDQVVKIQQEASEVQKEVETVAAEVVRVSEKVDKVSRASQELLEKARTAMDQVMVARGKLRKAADEIQQAAALMTKKLAEMEDLTGTKESSEAPVPSE